MPGELQEVDAWLDEEGEHTLYDEPVASDGEFFDYWHTPAVSLELNFMTKIYRDGFDSLDTSTLLQLEGELSILENHWETLDVPPSKMEHLRERMSFLRHAIRLAGERDAILFIS